MRLEESYLQNIIKAAEAIEKFLENIEKDEFLQNEMMQDAVIRRLTVIGEASARLSPELKKHYQKIPWKRMVGLRNIAAHVYFSLDLETIWSTATTQVEPLRKQVLEILQNEYPDFKPEAED